MPWVALYMALYWAQGAPERCRHTGTRGGLGQSGKSHEELPPPPPLQQQPARTTMAHGPPRNSTENRRPQTKPREGDHANTGRTPAASPRAAGYTPLPVKPPPAPPKQSQRKQGTSAPSPQQTRVDGNATTSQPPTPAPPSPPEPASGPPNHPPPTQIRHPRHPPYHQRHRRSPERNQSSETARDTNSASATTTRGPGSGARA